MSAPSDRRPHAAAHRPAGGGTRRRYGVEHVLVGCGLALLPWLVVLAGGLPGAAVTGHERIVWTGLDALEALGLVGTGLLARRGHRLHPLTATATATLLVADAWFDTMTAAPGADLVSAVAMAFGAELPLAVVCVVLAARGTRAAAGDGGGAVRTVAGGHRGVRGNARRQYCTAGNTAGNPWL
ncbi:hypothetical protein ABZ923_11130 [Streptomyces sp. NPDC046881]|uniref:hypothetical protein n=1 Tax=Streptomyces sp. NPDC046881 TaxID=3155374 RepID=UPI00341088C1